VDVGTAADGQAITFRNPAAASRWEIVSWVWPVRAGTGHRYERVVLMRTAGDAAHRAGPDGDLVDLARAVVASQMPVSRQAGHA
jgi:hypothetical protein